MMWFQRSDFRKLADGYFRRLEKIWGKTGFPADGSGPHFLVLVTPWGRTAVPFFSVEIALILRFLGARVTVIGDATNLLSNAQNAEEVKILRELLHKLRRFPMAVTTVDETTSDGFPQSVDVRDVAFENVVKQERSEAGARAYLLSHGGVAGRFEQHANRIAGLLSKSPEGTLILPGGIWGVSGVHAAAAKQLALPFWTYDSGHKFLAYARNGCAAHYPDFPGAFVQANEAVARNPKVRNAIVEAVRDRLALRRAGDDEYKVQLQSDGKNQASRCDVLILLNYRLDTAAMCRNRAFPDVTTWLRSVLEWLAEHTDTHVVVRQHPCERLPDFRSAEDYLWVEQIAPGRIRFVSCEELLNTYDVLEKCKVVLPHTSRSGLEAAAFGKPTIVCSEAYYKDCPFIQAAATPGEYFQLIARALESPPEANHELPEKSVAYYLADFCTLNPTPFTPVQSDLKTWLHRSPDELLADQDIRRFFDSLQNGFNPILLAFASRFPELLINPAS